MKLFVVDDDPAIRKNDASRRLRERDTFAVDGLRIHFPSQTVHVDGRLIELTDTEYRLLRHLVRNAGRVLSPRALLQQAWSADCATTDMVRFQVSRLRAKLEDGWATPRFIYARPGVGYWFRGPADGPVAERTAADDGRVIQFPTQALGALRATWQTLAARYPASLSAA